MIKTKKDFIKEFLKTNPFNKTLVQTVVNAYESWIKENLLAGNAVRIEFGKFCILENRYVPSGMQEKSVTFHRHMYRPSFKFLQKFKAEVDKAEEVITQTKKLE